MLEVKFYDSVDDSLLKFATELHSEMEKIVLLDELPEEWTYPLIQPKLIEKYLQMKNTIDFRLRA